MKRCLLVLVVIAGCSGSPDPVECWIVSPSDDSVVSAIVEVQIGYSGPAARFEMLVNGEVVANADAASAVDNVATLSWDSSTIGDGATTLAVRVEGDGSEDQSDALDIIVDNNAPQASLDIERLSVLQGEVGVPVSIDEANVAEARIMIGDTAVASITSAESTIAWDTTGSQSRLHLIRLVVTDAAGRSVETAEVPVIVANNGYHLEEDDITYDPGEWVVPAEHTRVQAAMNVPGTDPYNIVRVVTWLTWDPATAWRLDYTTGQGFCPHRGVQYAIDDSDSGEIILDVAWAELADRIRDAAMLNVPSHSAESEAFPFNNDPATCGAFFGHVNVLESTGNDIDIHANFVFIYGDE